MAKLTAAQRKRIPKSEYGLPGKKGKNGKNQAGKGGYPMPDRTHARVAKAYAKKELEAGKLSRAQYNQIVTHANRVLGESGQRKAIKKTAGMMRKSAGVKKG